LGVADGGASFGRSTTHQPVPVPSRRSADDVLAGVVGASAGAGVGRAAMWALSIGGALALAVAVVTAAAMAAAVIRSRSTSARRSRLRRWASEVVADATATWERDVASRVLAADSTLASAASARTADAIARRDARIAEIDTEIRAAAARASARAAAYQRDLDVLERFVPGDASFSDGSRGNVGQRDTSEGTVGSPNASDRGRHGAA
ncbi:MAG: hypothetical protein WBA00_07170, partial [Rhodococcus sp. (in: high G+C Gram-positive bacteria)]